MRWARFSPSPRGSWIDRLDSCGEPIVRGCILQEPFLQLRAGGLNGSTRDQFFADRPAKFSAGELALALTMKASFISIDG
jgi:hypothetical protein